MKKLRVSFGKGPETSLALELRRLEKEKGLTAAEVGRFVASKLGTNEKSESAQYGFPRRGERRIPESRIEATAEILGTSVESLRGLNDLLELETAVLDFDPSVNFQEFISDLPPDSMTLGRMLIWLSTEIERRRLQGLL